MSLDSSWIHEYESEGRYRKHFRIFINEKSEEQFNKGIKYIDKNIYKESEPIRNNSNLRKSRKQRYAIFTVIFLVMAIITIAISFFTTKFVLLSLMPRLHLRKNYKKVITSR